MAYMIPSIIDDNCSSPGEKEVFKKLKNDPGTQDWIVLHSLDISNHVRKVSGEIDFLLLIPLKGILCLEVKACSKLRREHGLWYYGEGKVPDSRGPFKQASQAMHSLRKNLLCKRPEFSRILFWSAVMFPYISFKDKSDEWHDWQVIDNSMFSAKPISISLEAILDHAAVFLEKCRSAKWFHPRSGEPTISQCKAIASVLRPNFEFFESARNRLKKNSEELKRFTEEQYIALDAMGSNPRVAFSGPAGTGKTLLAIEAARRGKNEGRKVLFLCFNRLLGKWLEDQTECLRPEVVTGTIHKQMLRISGQQLTPNLVKENSFWQYELPSQATEKLLENVGNNLLFDELVIDESQDVLRHSYLDFLDLILIGGLANGRWRFFGDFEKQAIYGDGGLPLEQFIRTKGNNAPVFSLRVNCRNTPRVTALVQILGDMQPGYTKVLRPDDKIEPTLFYYENEIDQEHILVETLTKLYAEGFSGGDIVILSPKASGSAAEKIDVEQWKNRLRPYDTVSKGYIGYSSIHAFKGLEAGVVIVTDIEAITGTGSNSLFYIALTRSLYKLVVIANNKVKHEVIDLLFKI